MSRFAVIPTVAYTDKRLSLRDLSTLGILASFSDKDGWAYPSAGIMAEMAGIARPPLIRSLNNLISCGYVEKKERYRSDGSQTSNLYRVLCDYTPPESQIRRTKTTEKGTGGVPTESTPSVPSESTRGVPSEGTPMKHPILNTPREHPNNNTRETALGCSFFDAFWSAYPKKVGKKKCQEIWKRRNLDKLGEMITADVTRRRIDDVQWLGGYIPNPQTYLNGDRWEDEIQTRRPSSAQGDKSQAAWDAAKAEFLGETETGNTLDGEFWNG